MRAHPKDTVWSKYQKSSIKKRLTAVIELVDCSMEMIKSAPGIDGLAVRSILVRFKYLYKVENTDQDII